MCKKNEGPMSFGIIWLLIGVGIGLLPFVVPGVLMKNSIDEMIREIEILDHQLKISEEEVKILEKRLKVSYGLNKTFEGLEKACGEAGEAAKILLKRLKRQHGDLVEK